MTATPVPPELTVLAPVDVPERGRPRQGRPLAMLAVFAQNRLAAAGLTLIVLVALFCFVGPLIYHTDQVHPNLLALQEPPGSPGHPLGTDTLGFDVLGRLMVGGQSSIEIGLGASVAAAVLGSSWGAVAAMSGGIVDAIMMRIVDAILSIPIIVLLLVIASMVTPSVPLLIGLIAAVSWLTPARLVRAETLKLKTEAFVEATSVMGGARTRIIVRHIIPNALGTIVVNASFTVADGILYVAYLSFLGLGIPPPATSWGAMLSLGVNYLFQGYWWLIWPPAFAIAILVVAFNLLGDGLRDALDPRLLRR